MMQLLIFGATGGTGLQLVQQALAQGHIVTAFARNPAQLEIVHKNLRLFQGDVLNPASVAQAMQGQQVVICALGSPAGKTGTIRSQGTKHIIQAMSESGIKRFVCLTSLGYGDSVQVLNRTPFYFKYLIVPFMLRKAFADHALQEAHIKQSLLEWVIVRPGNLTDGPYTGVYRHGFAASDKHIQVKVSRADVADFMLKQLQDNTYLKKTPGLSY